MHVAARRIFAPASRSHEESFNAASASERPRCFSTNMFLPRHLNLPPTLDQAGWEIPASSAARQVGLGEPRMKLPRRFAAVCGGIDIEPDLSPGGPPNVSATTRSAVSTPAA
jgi:hypothetical protein